MRRPIFMHQRQPTGGVRPNATQNGQTDPRTPCRSLLCRKSPLSRVGTSRQSRKSLQFAPLPSSSGESRLNLLGRGNCIVYAAQFCRMCRSGTSHHKLYAYRSSWAALGNCRSANQP
jgi:hypothetical protein